MPWTTSSSVRGFWLKQKKQSRRAFARDERVGPLAAQAAPAARRQVTRIERAALQRAFDAASAQRLEQEGHPLGTARVVRRAFHGDVLPEGVGLPRVPGEVVFVFEHGHHLRSGNRSPPHRNRVFLLELFETPLDPVDGSVELRQQDVLQRARAAHRAPVLERQPLQVAAHGGESRGSLDQRDERAPAGFAFRRRLDRRRGRGVRRTATWRAADARP